MRFEDGEAPFRHPYGNCVSNIPINELVQAGVPYYPLFAYKFNFQYVPQGARILGDAVLAQPIIRENYWNILYRVYGIECDFETKDSNKTIFLSRMSELLEKSSVPCIIDCFYDSSTEYANVYQKIHQGGHGRIVTGIDTKYIYYYATHITDPAEQFRMSLDDFYLACEKIMHFKYPAIPKSKEERHTILKTMLLEWFVETDYNRMLEDIKAFSEEIRTSSTLGDEIENNFKPGHIPVSHLFNRLVAVCQSRGTAIAFFEGYLDEFGNQAYQEPIKCLKRSLELWNLVKALLVKYGLAPKRTIQASMGDYLLEICDVEQEAIDKICKALCDELNINLSTERQGDW